MAVILTGAAIAAGIATGDIHIDDFDPARLEPNSYGFRLSADVLHYATDELDSFRPNAVERTAIGENGLVLLPGRLYLGSTMEAMGSPAYAATLYACRSVSTLGMWIHFSAPLGHSGAIFPWTLEITTANPIRIYAGMEIGKIAFWVMQGDPRQYRGKYTGSTSTVSSQLCQEART